MIGAEDFAQERRRLVAQYGIESIDGPEAQTVMLTSLPLKQAKALRTAEQRLVAEHSRRVAKRRSQIALQHAEEFQSLTQDYDRKISELLNDKERLQNDLSVEPTKFEQDLNDLRAKSKQLEARKAESIPNTPQSPQSIQKDADVFQQAVKKEQVTAKRASQLPQRAITSSPRTLASIPRAVQYPGTRHSADATSQPQSICNPTAGGDSTVAREQSKSPPDGPLPKRIVSAPRVSDKWASPSSAKAHAAQNSNTEPIRFEQPAAHKNGQPPLLSDATKTSRPRTKSGSLRHLRHSSGSIFKLFPKQE